MKIIGTTIVFTSNPKNYLKEKYGAKPNTVRALSNTKWCDFQDSSKNLKKIMINNGRYWCWTDLKNIEENNNKNEDKI